MAYVSPNFKSKAALKRAVAAGERVVVFQPGPFPLRVADHYSIEGPHFPAAHTWYGTAITKGGVVVKVT